MTSLTEEGKMLDKFLVVILALSVNVFAGCASHPKTGACIGGPNSGAIGKLLGGDQGFLVGGAAGVIGGGLIGASLDWQEARNLKAQNLQTYARVDNGEKLSVNDVIHLSKADLSDDKIVELIQKTNSRYHLNRYQIDKLYEAGVSELVIDYMLDTR